MFRRQIHISRLSSSDNLYDESNFSDMPKAFPANMRYLFPIPIVFSDLANSLPLCLFHHHIHQGGFQPAFQHTQVHTSFAILNAAHAFGQPA